MENIERQNTNTDFKKVEIEFQRHITDCDDSKKAHFDLADHFYESAALINKIKGFGLCSVTAWLLSSQFEGLLPEEHIVVRAMPLVLAIVVSVLSMIESILGYREKAMIHAEFAKKYHKLWRTCLNWETDFPDCSYLKEAKTAVKQYRDQLSDFNKDAPHLSSVLWKKISKIRKRSGYFDVSRYSFEELKK